MYLIKGKIIFSTSRNFSIGKVLLHPFRSQGTFRRAQRLHYMKSDVVMDHGLLFVTPKTGCRFQFYRRIQLGRDFPDEHTDYHEYCPRKKQQQHRVLLLLKLAVVLVFVSSLQRKILSYRVADQTENQIIYKCQPNCQNWEFGSSDHIISTLIAMHQVNQKSMKNVFYIQKCKKREYSRDPCMIES